MGFFSTIGRLVRRAAPVGAAVVTGGASAGLAAGIGLAAGRRSSAMATRGRSAFVPSSAPRSLVGTTRGPAIPRLPTGRGLTGPTRPAPGAGAAVARLIPGGRTGLTYAPYDLNTPLDRMGRPVAVQPEMTERITCPSGYVAVDLDGDGINDACMLKPVARSMGLHKSRPKPPVSGYDKRAITRAKAAKTRVKKLARDTGLYVADKRPTTRGKKK